MRERHAASGARTFLPPAVFSVVLVAMAAATRKVSDWLELALGSRFVPVLAFALALVGALVLAAALLRIRRVSGRKQRWARYSTVAAGLLMVLVPTLVSERGNPDQAAVERMHFVFYGLLALLFFRAFSRCDSGRMMPYLALVASSLVGLADESFQWYLALRTGEVFDVVLNAYAALCGVVVACGLMGRPETRLATPAASPARHPAAAWRSAGVLSALLVLGSAAFIDLAHLGFVVADSEVSFHSYFERSELLDLDASRDLKWQIAPPSRPFGSLQREDYFQTEAGEHVRLRNRALSSAGQASASPSRATEQLLVALGEQRILERYYSAFLALDARYPDLPFRFQLAPWSLERIENAGDGIAGPASRARAAGSRIEPYQSQADNGRIWLRPSATALWTLAVALAVAALVVALGVARLHRQPAMVSSAR